MRSKPWARQRAGPRAAVENRDRSDRHVLITIADTGPGIDPKVADKIFQPFFTTKPSGMGMGLSICKSIIEAHEGRLTATPGEPSGTVFQISLPNADANADERLPT